MIIGIRVDELNDREATKIGVSMSNVVVVVAAVSAVHGITLSVELKTKKCVDNECRFMER